MIHLMVTGIAVIISILVFCLLYAVSGTIEAAGAKSYLYINNRLKERKTGILNYQELKLFLNKNGAVHVIGRFAEPVRYLGLCIALLFLGMFLGSGINLIMAVCMGSLAAALPGIVIILSNKKCNDRILPDIKCIYQFIAIQTSAGVYISDALTECYEAVENKRLRKTMLKLSNEIAMEGNVEEALDHFSESFDNSYIDTFCIIIKQSMESGRAVDLLNDMVEQLREVENNILVKKEEKLRRKTGIYQMAFFAGAMVFFIYAFVYDIGKLITNF